MENHLLAQILLLKKKVKKVFFSLNDVDKRTANKSKKILKKANIQSYKIK